MANLANIFFALCTITHICILFILCKNISSKIFVLLIFTFFFKKKTATWYRVMQTEDVIYGTGKQRNCTKNGKHTMECASMYCGIRTSLLSSLRLVGTGRSSIGINGSILGSLIFRTIFCMNVFIF